MPAAFNLVWGENIPLAFSFEDLFKGRGSSFVEGNLKQPPLRGVFPILGFLDVSVLTHSEALQAPDREGEGSSPAQHAGHALLPWHGRVLGSTLATSSTNSLLL